MINYDKVSDNGSENFKFTVKTPYPAKSGQGGGGISHGTKLISILVVCLLVSLALVGSASAFAGGSGTEADPYQISNTTELQSMEDYLSSYFILNNDIDCSSLSSWNSIGSGSSNTFQGHLEGNNKTIRNVNLTFSSYGVGFLGWISNGASIKNCIFDNVNCTTSAYDIGIVCGIVTSSGTETVFDTITVQNSTVSANATNGVVGGIVAGVNYYSKCKFVNCICKNVSINGDNCVGGIVGSVSSSIASFDNNCKCENCIITATNNYVGGFIGFVSSTTNVVRITISENSSKGDGGEIINCYISSTSRGNVGGFVGKFMMGTSDTMIVRLDGCVISSSTVKGTSSIGGMLGFCAGRDITTVNNPTVKNSTVISTSGVASGVVAYWG